jgi:hypothetical protein
MKMFIIAGMLLIAACAPFDPADPRDQSMIVARIFVENSPTYQFDGFDLEHVETIELADPGTYQHVFEFTSRQAGYGDRTGQGIAQVITPHRAVITVENNQVTRAVMDGQWDMMEQEMIDAGNNTGNNDSDDNSN